VYCPTIPTILSQDKRLYLFLGRLRRRDVVFISLEKRCPTISRHIQG